MPELPQFLPVGVQDLVHRGQPAVPEEGMRVDASARGAGGWHRFRLGDLKLLLGVGAGSLHVLDGAAWAVAPYLAEGGPRGEILDSLAGLHGRGEIGEALAELRAVREQEELSCQGRPVGEAGGGEPVLKALCLHVSQECNMRCAYCFATEARAREKGLMSPRVARAAVDFLLEASASRRYLEIDFFGGEPLLNLAVVAETVGYAESRAAAAGKNISFTLTTNGLLLDEEARRFLEAHGVSVILSLDGRKEVHDRMRRLASGDASYERVAANLRRFVAKGPRVDYWVRGTYTRFNSTSRRTWRTFSTWGSRTFRWSRWWRAAGNGPWARRNCRPSKRSTSDWRGFTSKGTGGEGNSPSSISRST